MQLTDEEGNVSAVNNQDGYIQLLEIIRGNKTDDQVGEDLIELLGFHNFELVSGLIEKREAIKQFIKHADEQLKQQQTQV